MLASDLRDVMRAFDERGDLKRVDNVDWNLELGAITELIALRDGPALLFDHIRGYPAGYRVMTNFMNSPRRAAMLLGLSPEVRGVELVRAIRDRFAGIELVDPVAVPRAPWQEESHRGEAVDLWKLPTPFWHENDGGRYLGTAAITVTRDPDSQWVNVGTYRSEVHDERTMALFIEPSHHAALIRARYWERGEPCPVAICIGVQPALFVASFLGVPANVSEFHWAGGLMGEPVAVVQSDVTGLPLPASAEIVIEGFSPPPAVESRIEGPFGETTGYYGSGAREEAVVRVESLGYRANPILLGSPPLRPPASSSASYLFRAANIWREMEAAGVPDIRGVWMMPSGSSYFMAVVSIKQRYSGHARQAGLAAMSGRAGGGNYGRFVIVVDDDIDPSDQDAVLWALATRCDPERAISIVPDCTSGYLDPALPPEKRARHEYTSSRAVLDACRPYHWKKDFPLDVGTSPELKARIMRDWPDLFR